MIQCWTMFWERIFSSSIRKFIITTAVKLWKLMEVHYGVIIDSYWMRLSENYQGRGLICVISWSLELRRITISAFAVTLKSLYLYTCTKQSQTTNIIHLDKPVQFLPILLEIKHSHNGPSRLEVVVHVIYQTRNTVNLQCFLITEL